MGERRKSHRWPIRIYYEDTDHGGVVYHANYLRYLERARTELLREAGIELDVIERRWGIIFAVTSLTIDYRRPARFNDRLLVISALQKLRGARLSYRQRIVRDDGERPLISEAEVELAALNGEGRPRRIPDPLRKRLRALAASPEESDP